ncbi:MAG TPA: D-glycero-beta-D-manno-heptose-7-phosphate kinase [Vicinamibacteria bacterium]|jgi:D-beta-D-heptose 7-phosphate kinase/D-beta-D-heptose 1-phosphate adenosyltransferase|nr:D-glycero-beta-D-manno-heptose-7-phosphate kinase [Vicinamibacteria bacterium]
MKPLAAPRGKALLERMAGHRVMVVGDVMLDEFIWGDVVRISPEAPVPVVEVRSQSFHLGGAGNVASNVRSLGGMAVLAGVIGRDAAGDKVREAAAAAGIDDRLTVADSGRPTTVKTRIIAHHQQVVRADREQADDVPDELEGQLIDRIRAALPGCGALVLSDYQKGVITPRVVRAALSLARKRGIHVLVDPKVPHVALYRGAAVVTPNLREAEQASGIAIRRPEDLSAAARRLLDRLQCQAIVITRGEQGMSVYPRQGRPTHIPTAAREVFDVTGAGDTVIATLALALAAGARLGEAAALANYAAGVVVGKLGTATASPAEVLAAMERSPAA